MSDAPIQREPPRLIHEEGEMARLLRRAEPEFRKKLDESGAWGRVQRTQHRRVAVAWAVSTTAVMGLVVAISTGASGIFAEKEGLALAPEPVTPQVTPEPPNVTSAGIPEAPIPLPAEPAPPISRSLEASPVPVNETSCRGLSAQGKVERAVECFRVLSRGHGVAAEVALYEATRLSAEGLGDHVRTLALIDEHVKRFPSGALRGEMGWLRVQALKRAGRNQEALSASEELLASPFGRPLASDLHLLRGRLLEAQGDCSGAASEFVALIGEAGPRGDEAEIRRARCLEQLGRPDDAAAAYERYLRRDDPARAAEARARLSALKE